MAEKNKQDEKTKTEKKPSIKSLAEELRERLMYEKDTDNPEEIKEELEKKIKGRLRKENISEEEIEEISGKLTKEEIKKEEKELKKNVDGKKETLIPLEDYIKCAVHLGTKVITPHMRRYVYKRRADGLAVINTALIDEKLREAIGFLLDYEPEKVYIACKREAGWIPVRLFEKFTGIRAFTKKYPPGITTNLELDNFFEPETAVIADPWIDKNALNDTFRLKKPILSLCDTNNYTDKITRLIPCNNKSRKSIGCILYILAREYCKNKKLPFDAKLEDFTGELE